MMQPAKHKTMTESYYTNAPNNLLPDNPTTQIMAKCNALDFHKSLAEYRPTPLLALPAASKRYGVGNIFVKDESKRFGLNAFKGLGASFAMHEALLKSPSIETFCTATDGNHGLAVSWAAQKNGKRSVVFVPQTTTDRRMEAIAKYGATVVRIRGNYDEACRKAEKETHKNTGYCLIQDTAWEGYTEIPAWIVSGYLTLFREMEDSLHPPLQPQVDVVFLQAGVGSMAAAGVFYYLSKYWENKPKIVIVEPEEADGILCSFQKGQISTSRGSSKTIMAGLNCETPSLGAWDLLKNGVDYSIKIRDEYAKKAMRQLYFPSGGDPGIISGESGAAGFAGFLSILEETELAPVREQLKLNTRSNLLFINTEGDTDQAVFHQIIHEGAPDKPK